MAPAADEPEDPLRAARAEAEATGVEPVKPSGPPAGEVPGDLIDRYRLLEEIGEGGMGSVWLAEQVEPVRRKVALKVIKLGMDTKEVVVRFEAERQALALMDHPHIAKVLDGGATRTGRPYFVMELVRGTPITEYCNAANADLRERLQLFTKVCAAVQHAHQKGIIHRDLKPGNVLVTLHDGVPVPKVIDFGIAKATSAELTQKTMFTQHAQILGTPEYMAPEQAEMSGLDIDTRADIYSLGVLLYELLTGTKPFDIRDVLQRGYMELLRTIREEEPARPSTRVSTLRERPSPVSLAQQIDVATLSKRLRGDLDWIVMKALEKNRKRRYETASGFAADVTRFLRQEPVLAAPPTAAYRFRKFIQRRRKTVTAVAGAALLLIAGSIGTGIGLWRAMRANAALDVALDEKSAALDEEERQRALAQESEARARDAEQEARARAAELEQVASFQSTQLADLDPEVMGVRLRRSLIEAVPDGERAALVELLARLNFTSLATQTLRENLFDRTLEAIDKQFEDQPLVQAGLLHTLANTLSSLGLLEMGREPGARALALRRAYLGNEHPDTLSSMIAHAEHLDGQGRLEEAEGFHLEALETAQRSLGEGHPLTLRIIHSLGVLFLAQGRLDEGHAQLVRALEGRRSTLGEDHPDTLESLIKLATALMEQGNARDAERRLREALEHPGGERFDEQAGRLVVMGNLGTLLAEQGRVEEAEDLCRRALEGYRRELGAEHPSTVAAVNAFALVLRSQGRWEEAERYFREALELSRSVLGEGHPNELLARANYASILEDLGRGEEAESLFREVLGEMRVSLGPGHHYTLGTLSNFGNLLSERGNHEEAESCLRECVEGMRSSLGSEHARTLLAINNLGTVLLRHGNLEEADRFLEEAVDTGRRASGPRHPGTLLSVLNLSNVRQMQGLHAEAEALALESFDGYRQTLGDEHPDTHRAAGDLRGDLEMNMALRRAHGDAEKLGEALGSLGAILLWQGHPARAEAILEEAVTLLGEARPEGSAFYQALGALGAALGRQGRFDEGSLLVAESAEWMLAHPTDPATATVLERMVGLHDAWHAANPEGGQDEVATEWRVKLEGWRAEHAGAE